MKHIDPIASSWQRTISRNTGGVNDPGWEIQRVNTSAFVSQRLDCTLQNGGGCGNTFAGGGQQVGPVFPNPEEWHNFTFSYGPTGTILGNGNKQGRQIRGSDGNIAGSNTFDMGAGLGNALDVIVASRQSFNQFYPGRIDEVGIWKEAMEQSEIETMGRVGRVRTRD